MSDRTDSPDPVATKATTSQGSHAALNSYFDRCALAILDIFNRLEKSFLKPVLCYLFASFEQRPVFTTFITVGGLFVFLPILSFLGASVFVLSTCLFIGVGISLTTSSLIISLFASLLVFALGLLLSFAAAITLGGTFLYLGLRLAFLLVQNGRDVHGILPTFFRWFYEDVCSLLIYGTTTLEAAGQGAQEGGWFSRFFEQSPSTLSSGSIVVRKPDGSQDGPATMAHLREIHPETFARKFGGSGDAKNGEPSTILEKKQPEIDAQWKQHRFSSFRGDRSRYNSTSTVATKDDGTQDGPATTAKYSRAATGADSIVNE